MIFDIIDAMYYSEGEGGNTSVHPALGDLTILTSLENLDVPAVALWGLEDGGLVNPTLSSIVHTLPSTIKRLGISSWNEYPDMELRAFDEREESEMGMLEVLTADDRILKNLEVLKVSEGSNLLHRGDVVMDRKANGDIETRRRMSTSET